MSTTITKGYVKGNIDKLTADFIKPELISSGKLTVGRVLLTGNTYLIAYVPSVAETEAYYDSTQSLAPGIEAPKWERNFYAMEDAGSGHVEPVKKPTKYRVEVTGRWLEGGATSVALTYALLIRAEGGTPVYSTGTMTCTTANGTQTLTLEVENEAFVQPEIMFLVEDQTSSVADNTVIEVHYTIDSYVDFAIPA